MRGAHELTQTLLRAGPQHRVPAVGHQAIRQEIDGTALEPLREELLERREIATPVEQPHPAIAAIEHMADQARL